MSLPLPLTRRARRLALHALEDRLAPATLQGTVWHDLNANGAHDAGEPGLAGRTVFLDANGNGTFDAGETSQATAADGGYSFTGLAAGTYNVTQAGPAGWVGTSPRSGPLAPGSLAGAAWTEIGPFGGDVVGAAVSPVTAGLVLAAVDSETTTSHGGLYCSTDNGASWVEVPFFRDTQVHAVAYGPTGAAYAGTFTGLYRSTDNGTTWTRVSINNQTYQTVYAVATHPADANTLLVGLNSGFGQQPATVWKTTDGGASWTDRTPAGVVGRVPRAVAFDPADPTRAYLGFAGGFSPGALFSSADGGSTWTKRSLGGQTDPHVRGFAFAGGAVFAAGGSLFGQQAVGLYRSSDGGADWSSLSDTWPERYATSVAVDPTNPQVIVVGTDRDGVYRTVNGGVNWTYHVGGTADTKVNGVRFSGGRVLAATGPFGVLASTDGGATFNPSSIGIAEFETTSGAVNPTNPAEMVLTYSRLNTGGVLRSTDGGLTWNRESIPATRFTFATYAPDGRLFVAAAGGSATSPEGLYRRNPDGTWTSLGPNFVPDAVDADVRAVAFSPIDPNVFVAVGQTAGGVPNPADRQKAVVWKTIDGGQSWQQAYLGSSTDPTVFTAATDVAWLQTATGTVILVTIADNYNQVPINGGILRIRPGALPADPWTWTFTGSGQNGLPTSLQANGLAPSATNPNKVYLANGYAWQSGLVFLSTDAGQTWTERARSDVVSGMGGLLVDPADDRIVYGTAAGQRVSRSVDSGLTWAPFDGGLDNVPWFYGRFDLSHVATPAPRLVVSTLGGLFATETYSTKAASRSVTVAAAETVSSLDFGSRALPGEVAGLVWEDADADGQFIGEFARPDQVVYLDANNNGALDVGEPSHKTHGSGEYRLTGLTPGNYTVRRQAQAGTRQTFPASDGGHAVTVPAGATVGGKDFGFQVLPVELRGTKWEDTNGDGDVDAGEPGLPGWKMYLDLNANGAPDPGEPTTVTDAQGRYVLTARDPGVYLLDEVPAPYWAQTGPGDGNSQYEGQIGFEPAYGTWADRDPATPSVIDIWYDFRDWTHPTTSITHPNAITDPQKAIARAALDRWEQATGGKLKFTQKTAAEAAQADVMTIGTGDLAATGGASQPGGVAGQGWSGTGTGTLGNGIVWMDEAETWDTTIGNGQQAAVDYFSVALHEIGHAIGLNHVQNTPHLWRVAMAPTLTWEYTDLSPVDIDGIRRLYGGADNRGGFYVVSGERGVVRDGLNFGARRTGTPPYADLFLDVGNPFSPVAAGYSQVHQETVYNPYTRFGWSAGTDRFGWDTGIGSSLLRDYVDTVDSTFAADLPSGTYDVTVTLGAPFWSFDQMQVSLEGTPVATIDDPNGQTIPRTFRVSVVDGQLTIWFRDLGGQSPKVAINAITVARVPDTLTVSVNPTSVGEAAGAGAATGTVARTGDVSQPLTVTLASSDTTEATVPATVLIPAGQASATFPIDAVDDLIIDAIQTATISAMAADYTGGSAPLAVTDNDRGLFTAGKIDFGTNSSPVAAGFMGVTAGTAFTEALGYGWTAGSIGATDRGTGGAVNRDFNSTRDGTFAVNVANGTYTVTLTIGDARAARDRMAVSLEGAEVASSLSTRAGQFVKRSYTVRVTDGQLTLRLRDLGGRDPFAVINALEFRRKGN